MYEYFFFASHDSMKTRICGQEVADRRGACDAAVQGEAQVREVLCKAIYKLGPQGWHTAVACHVYVILLYELLHHIIIYDVMYFFCLALCMWCAHRFLEGDKPARTAARQCTT